MGHDASLIDVLIALLQSMAVLLLASGIYIALVVRKAEESPRPTEAEPSVPARGPHRIA